MYDLRFNFLPHRKTLQVCSTRAALSATPPTETSSRSGPSAASPACIPAARWLERSSCEDLRRARGSPDPPPGRREPTSPAVHQTLHQDYERRRVVGFKCQPSNHAFFFSMGGACQPLTFHSLNFFLFWRSRMIIPSEELWSSVVIICCYPGHCVLVYMLF